MPKKTLGTQKGARPRKKQKEQAGKRNAKKPKKKLFLAGPMGSPSEIAGQTKIADAFRPKFDVYLAPCDGVEVKSLIDLIDNPSNVSEPFVRAALLVQQIGWAHEIYQVLSSDVIVLNLDGRVPDEGAVVEAASAFMAGKPVVTFKDTPVTFWPFFDNPMVAALDTTWQTVSPIDELRKKVDKVFATPASTPSFHYVPPANVQKAYDFGAWVVKEFRPLMAALEKAAAHLPIALQRLEPSMGSMQTFAEELIAGTASVDAKTARTDPVAAKRVRSATLQAARKAFA
jgi:nucleoside 2-deoxyribosyltransferase